MEPERTREVREGSGGAENAADGLFQQPARVIRVVLPYHLRTLAQVGGEVSLEIEGPVTQRAILDALEARYPMLSGTIRDHVTQKRRPFLRFFACGEDLTFEPPNAPLPDSVASGEEAFLIVGAIAGG
jgi:sulfur-carrier protein